VSAARARLLAAIPLLAAASIERGVAFYGRIGFRPLFVSDEYAALMRDDVHLHLWRCGDRVADNTACRIRVEGIDALYEECRARCRRRPSERSAARNGQKLARVHRTRPARRRDHVRRAGRRLDVNFQ